MVSINKYGMKSVYYEVLILKLIIKRSVALIVLKVE